MTIIKKYRCNNISRLGGGLSFWLKATTRNKFCNNEWNLKYWWRWKQVFWELKGTSKINIQWSWLWLVSMHPWFKYKALFHLYPLLGAIISSRLLVLFLTPLGHTCTRCPIKMSVCHKRNLLIYGHFYGTPCMKELLSYKPTLQLFFRLNLTEESLSFAKFSAEMVIGEDLCVE